MNEIDVERASSSPSIKRAYGTFSQLKERNDLECDEANRRREWEKGALAGSIISATFFFAGCDELRDYSVYS
jgi:hypothetical protein